MHIEARKLGRDAFAKAIRNGRGAALMHAKAYGLDGVEDLVLDSCLHDRAYDRQCEDDRSPWLFEMFRNSPQYPRFADAFARALAAPSEDLFFEQVCGLLALMSEHGDVAAGRLLRQAVWAQTDPSEGLAGKEAIIALDGIPAGVDVCRRLGQFRIAAPDEYWSPLAAFVENKELYTSILAELRRMAPFDVAIATFVANEQKEIEEDAIEATRTNAQREADRAAYAEEQRNAFPLERILADARDHKHDRAYVYVRFGRFASADDLDHVMEHLAAETDPETCRRLLWVFRDAILPRWQEPLWALAQDGDVQVRSAAHGAMAGMVDPRIGELARRLLRASDFSVDDGSAIELLSPNYQLGDEELIVSALGCLTLDDDDAHDLCYKVKSFCSSDVGQQPSLARWLYDTNPCTICRSFAVDLLQKLGPLDPVVLEECRYDASREVQALVKPA